MYTFDSSGVDIAATTMSGGAAQKFCDRVFFTSLVGVALSVIPDINITDHVSGQT